MGRFFLLLTILVLTACVERRTQQGCRMSAEFVVSKTRTAPRALRMLRLDENRTLLLWSSDGTASAAILKIGRAHV